MFRWEPNKSKPFRHSFLKCTGLTCTLTSEDLDKWRLNICWTHYETAILLKISRSDIFIDSRRFKVGSPVLSNICMQSYLEWVVLAQSFGRVFTQQLALRTCPEFVLMIEYVFCSSWMSFLMLTGICCYVYRGVRKIKIKSKFKATNYIYFCGYISIIELFKPSIQTERWRGVLQHESRTETFELNSHMQVNFVRYEDQ